MSRAVMHAGRPQRAIGDLRNSGDDLGRHAMERDENKNCSAVTRAEKPRDAIYHLDYKLRAS